MLQEYLEEINCLKYLLPEGGQQLIYIHAKKLEKQCKPIEEGGNNETSLDHKPKSWVYSDH